MTNLKETFDLFLSENFINNYEEFSRIVVSFPYYCRITNIENTNYVRLNITENSIKSELLESNMLDYFDNFIISKTNIKKFYFFEKTYYPLVINSSFKLENTEMYLEHDYLKYYLFYDGKKWILSSPGYEDISSLLEKKSFEKYTLFDMFNKYANIYNLKIEKLNPSYNYVFGISCYETNLIMNHMSISNFCLLSISSNNKNIKITKNELSKISKFISYPKLVNFESKKIMKSFINTNKEYSKIKLIKDGEYFFISLDYYKKYHRILDNIIIDPFRLVCKNYDDFYFNNLKNMFKSLTDLLELQRTKITVIGNYFLKLYRDDKILKKENLIYLQYDKEIIQKIHNIYRTNRTPIHFPDIILVLSELPRRKTDVLFSRL